MKGLEKLGRRYFSTRKVWFDDKSTVYQQNKHQFISKDGKIHPAAFTTQPHAGQIAKRHNLPYDPTNPNQGVVHGSFTHYAYNNDQQGVYSHKIGFSLSYFTSWTPFVAEKKDCKRSELLHPQTEVELIHASKLNMAKQDVHQAQKANEFTQRPEYSGNSDDIV